MRAPQVLDWMFERGGCLRVVAIMIGLVATAVHRRNIYGDSE
jgi:hypothetical protein